MLARRLNCNDVSITQIKFTTMSQAPAAGPDVTSEHGEAGWCETPAEGEAEATKFLPRKVLETSTSVLTETDVDITVWKGTFCRIDVRSIIAVLAIAMKARLALHPRSTTNSISIPIDDFRTSWITVGDLVGTLLQER
jgi:hypothetical protein